MTYVSGLPTATPSTVTTPAVAREASLTAAAGGLVGVVVGLCLLYVALWTVHAVVQVNQQVDGILGCSGVRLAGLSYCKTFAIHDETNGWSRHVDWPIIAHPRALQAQFSPDCTRCARRVGRVGGSRGRRGRGRAGRLPPCTYARGRWGWGG